MIALFSSALLAQNLGASNKHSIGSDEDPVLATEYCAYLTDMAHNDRPFFESDYYDSSFMHTDQNRKPSPNAAIERTGRNAVYVSGCVSWRSVYHYSVVPNHEGDRIVAVYWKSVQTEFNNWRAAPRRNPTRQELCDYINAKIAGQLESSYLDQATEIQNRYPNAAMLSVID